MKAHRTLVIGPGALLLILLSWLGILSTAFALGLRIG